MKTKDNAWTDEDVRRMGQMFRAGRKYAEIAQELGRTRRAVISKIKKLQEEDPYHWHVIKHQKRMTNPCPDCLYGSGLTDPVTHFKCPWADHGGIVPGWDAEAVPYYVHNTNCKSRVDITYNIKSCPHFKEG